MLGILLLTGFYVGWNIGANDTANCIGTSVGSGLISYRKAAFLIAFFILAGGLLQSHGVMETMDRGIVTEKLPLKAIFIAMISSGLFVNWATFFGNTDFYSQAVVGAIIGVGLVKGTRAISKRTIGEIITGWAATPSVAGLMAFGLYRLITTVI